MKRLAASAAGVARKSVDAAFEESIPAGTLWMCGRCPYLSPHLPVDGRCPMCAVLMIGQCECGAVVMGEERHPCIAIRTA